MFVALGFDGVGSLWGLGDKLLSAMVGISHFSKDLCIWQLLHAKVLDPNKFQIPGEHMSSCQRCWWAPKVSPRAVLCSLTTLLKSCSNPLRYRHLVLLLLLSILFMVKLCKQSKINNTFVVDPYWTGSAIEHRRIKDVIATRGHFVAKFQLNEFSYVLTKSLHKNFSLILHPSRTDSLSTALNHRG